MTGINRTAEQEDGLLILWPARHQSRPGGGGTDFSWTLVLTEAWLDRTVDDACPGGVDGT